MALYVLFCKYFVGKCRKVSCKNFHAFPEHVTFTPGGGRVVRWCWVSFQCLLIWIIVGQGPIALAVGAGGG